MTPTRLSEVDEAEIVLRYRKGATVRELADRFDVDASSIRRCLERHEEPTREPRSNFMARRAEVSDETIVGLRDGPDRPPWSEVATICGMSVWGVRSRYERAKRRSDSADGR